MSNLENFDDLFVGDPVEIEKNLKELLPEASALKNQSTYLQILSQIALAQAVQKNFDSAHTTLNHAEKLLTSKDYLARTRILLERGRVFMQSGNNEAARPYFFESYELGKLHLFDEHTANAAHMIAIVAITPEEKIEWNSLAIDLAKSSSSQRAKAWRGSLYNNLGQAYIEAGQYEKALQALEIALEFRKEEKYPPNIRVAQWAVARALRLLDKRDEALSILLPLLEEYTSMEKQDNLDFPREMLPSVRGLVYEELAELSTAESKNYAQLAYKDLSNDDWFKNFGSKRLERLKQLGFNI